MPTSLPGRRTATRRVCMALDGTGRHHVRTQAGAAAGVEAATASASHSAAIARASARSVISSAFRAWTLPPALAVIRADYAWAVGNRERVVVAGAGAAGLAVAGALRRHGIQPLVLERESQI